MVSVRYRTPRKDYDMIPYDKNKDPRSVAKRGEHNPRAKLSEVDVSNIKGIAMQEGLKRGWQRRLALKYNVSPQLVNDIIKGRKWAEVKVFVPGKGQV